MQDFHRQKFAENSSRLCEMIDFSALKPKLVESRLFTTDMLADIEDFGPSDVAMNEELLRCVTKRGPKAFERFLCSLMDSGQMDVTRILDDLIPDDGLWHGQVTRAISWPTDKKVYRMASRPRGVALIISNTVFENDVCDRRYGGEVDEDNLQRLFKDLGFELDIHRNKNRRDILKVLNDFKTDERHSRANACIVVIMSHGNDDGFQTAEGNLIANEDVIDIFNNVNCPKLHWKPKIFFFVHCRGDKLDHVVRGGFNATETRFGGIAFDAVPSRSRKQVPSLATYSDMRICYSTCPAFISMRCNKRGSWFISIFVETCSQCAHDTDLDTMLRDVSNRLASLELVCGLRQIPEYTERGWRHKLLFNPGLYE